MPPSQRNKAFAVMGLRGQRMRGRKSSLGHAGRVIGVLQHLAAGLGLFAGGIEDDVLGDLGEVAQREIDGGEKVERIGADDRLLTQPELKDLTHYTARNDTESRCSVAPSRSGSG